MRYVHAADLHLDSPLRGLERHEGAPVEEIRGATRRAFDNLIDLCLTQEASFLLLSGDLYDGDWKDYSTGLFMTKRLAQLREAGTRVFLIRGNHDAASRITKQLELPDNCTELATRAPETVIDEDLGVAVHGQGYAQRAVTVDLAADYPDALTDLHNIGLLHTALDGREGHDPYAPTSVELLGSKGYDYWALGHVHQREVLATDPWIVFPGNPQGRHARELGAKGASLVEVDDGRVVSVEHQVLDVVRWERVEVDVTDFLDLDEILEHLRHQLERATTEAGGRLLAARVVLNGRCEAHAELGRDPEVLEAAARALAAELDGSCWIEKIQLNTLPPLSLEELTARHDLLGQVLDRLQHLRDDDEALLALGDCLGPLAKKLPLEARRGDDGFDPKDPAWLRTVLDSVQRRVLPHLLDR
ncbi:MAG: DNA repair exonuclease [Acidobacteriota bacterium]